MNQVVQWFSILQHGRLRLATCAILMGLTQREHAFLAERNQRAHPFNWSSESVVKITAQCEEPHPLTP
jgi:hypothetical protein